MEDGRTKGERGTQRHARAVVLGPGLGRPKLSFALNRTVEWPNESLGPFVLSSLSRRYPIVLVSSTHPPFVVTPSCPVVHSSFS